MAPTATAATGSTREAAAATATSGEREREGGAGVAMGERGRSRPCRTQREESGALRGREELRDGKMRMKP
jgi:hypothetical protein